MVNNNSISHNVSHRSFNKEIRQIRIFISSSFEDMNEERDYLRNTIVPILQEKARLRGVAITALDLRWGIPKGTDLGETIEICMNEIDNSYPFFIGIVGKSYGTQPNMEIFDNSIILKEKFGILKRYFESQLSITDMEMRYGVLDCNVDEQSNMDALFLIRTKDLTDIDEHDKLKKLKDDIQRCGTQYKIAINSTSKHGVVIADYDTLEKLGEIVINTFDRIINNIFPNEQKQDIFCVSEHRQQATLSELNRFYIPNTEQLDAITTFVRKSNKQYFLISGESGSGKSALLAYWISKNQDILKNDGIDIIYHFVGDGVDNEAKLIERRLVKKIKTIFSLEEKNKETLFDVFRDIPQSRNLVIIIDAINQLSSGGDMYWIPRFIPNNIKYIYTSLTDSIPNKIISSNKEDLHIYGITNRETQQEIIKRYIYDFHRRRIEEDNINRVLEWPLSGNPLALRTLMDELLVVGQYDKMQDIIDYYIRSQSINDFFELVLSRIISNKTYSWVEKVLALIASTKYGLSETEIIRLTGVHPLFWSSFYNSFRRHFIVKNGLISFSHQYLTESVASKFLDTPEKRNMYHTILIPLFKNTDTVRDVEELFYQHTEGHVCDSTLYSLLSTPAFFSHLYEKSPKKVIKAWSILYKNGFDPSLLIVNYKDYSLSLHENSFLSVNDYFGEYVWSTLDVFKALYCHSLGQQMYDIYIEWTKISFAAQDWIIIHRKLAELYMSIGYFDDAIKYYKKGFIMTSTTPGEKYSIGYSEDKKPFDFTAGYWQGFLFCIGECYRRLGNYDQSITFLNKSLEQAKEAQEELDYKNEGKKAEVLSDIYWALSQIYTESGDEEAAKRYFDKSVKEMGSIDTIAELYIKLEKPRSAFNIYHQMLKNNRIAYGENDIQYAIDYCNIGRCYLSGGLVDIAYRCYKKAHEYIGSANAPYIQANIDFGMANCLYKQKKYDEAHNFYETSAMIYKSIGLYPNWFLAQYNVATSLANTHNYDKGVRLLRGMIEEIRSQNYCMKSKIFQIEAAATDMEWLDAKYKSLKYVIGYFNVKQMKENKSDKKIEMTLEEKRDCINSENKEQVFCFERYIKTSTVSNLEWNNISVTIHFIRGLWIDKTSNEPLMNKYYVRDKKNSRMLVDFDRYLHIIYASQHNIMHCEIEI